MEKLIPLSQCLQDLAGGESNAFGDPVSMHTIAEWQKHIEPKDFYAESRTGIINAFAHQHKEAVYRILSIDNSLVNDAEVRLAAENYFLEGSAKGWEVDEELKKLFLL